MKLTSLKRILPCFFFTMVVLTVPAFAAGQTVSGYCVLCGEPCPVEFNPQYCFTFYTFCSDCGRSGETVEDLVEHTFSEINIPATCTVDGRIGKECTNCQFFFGETTPAPGHAWTETSRTEATSAAPGSIEYVCSACNETKTETIPQLPDTPAPGGSLTLAALLQTMTKVFSAACEWVGVVSSSVVSNPILLLGVVIGFIGTGVGLFRRLLNL